MKKFIKILALLLAAAVVFFLCACSVENGNGENTTDKATQQSENTSEKQEDTTEDPLVSKLKEDFEKINGTVKVEVKMKDFGTFTLELYPKYAPKTVENFVKLVKSGYYEGSKFHRVVEGFMAQGGISAKGEKAEKIKGEFSQNGYTGNTIKHEKGVISMARATDPDSASDQFFICYDNRPDLDGKYAAFGKVISGMDVVDSFLKVERISNGYDYQPATPVTDIIIESMTVL